MNRTGRVLYACITGVILLGWIGGVAAAPAGPLPATTGTLTVTLEAGDYTVRQEQGLTTIEMAQDFGTWGSAPGQPRLPGRAFFIALPPGAQVTGVEFATPEVRTLTGSYRLATIPPVGSDGPDAGAAGAAGASGPAAVGTYLGQDQWRRYTFARVAYRPFSYQPSSGLLRFHPRLVVTLSYRLPEPGSPAWQEVERLRSDHVMDDLIAPYLVNFDQARAWYDGPAGPLAGTSYSLYDYVIIVKDDTMAAAVAPLKTWKETLGHTVNVVTLAWIQANYSGSDTTEQIWNFLHDKYPSSAWGIRYVLLVGGLDVILNRLLFYSNPPSEWGLQADHFFAKLSSGTTQTQVWNKDGDQRWGEIDADEISLTPDVLVGRLPLNTTTSVGLAIQAIISFEQSPTSAKRSALLAGGYNDIASATTKTDNAVLMEYIRSHVLTPNGWDTTRLYEQTGLGTSTYTPPPDYDTSPSNVVAAWNASPHGLVILADHGNTQGLGGYIWKVDNPPANNQVDDGETVQSDLFGLANVTSLTTTNPPIVELLGCATHGLTTMPWPKYTLDPPGGYTMNTGSTLLAYGAAAAVVGFDSPIPYMPHWTGPTVLGSQTVGYYFTQNLVQNRYTLGWSLYEAKLRYTNDYYAPASYEPIPYSFDFFGDPAMTLDGYDMSARGTNTLIHSGAVYGYGTDNADNGDMYVGVSTQPDDVDGQVKVYQSTDHGSTWNLWATISHGSPILAVDLLVGEWKQDEFSDSRVHVFFTDVAGNVWDARIDMQNPSSIDYVLLSSEGPGQSLYSITAARDPVPTPGSFYVYVTWGVGADTPHTVKWAYSGVNGLTGSWSAVQSAAGYQQPHIEAGPSDHVYLAAVGDAYPNEIYLARSTDRGASWGSWDNLTYGDEGDYHAVPTVGVSSDAAIPTVWVAYTYYQPVALGGADVRYAHSTDGGDTWTQDQLLSAEPMVDELNPDMASYRTGPSRWINVAYDEIQSARTNVIWRWASGSTPGSWSASRLMNDNATHPAMGPQVIYSPGVTVTGSGVVYPGTGSPITNLYFAAPWLTQGEQGQPSAGAVLAAVERPVAVASVPLRAVPTGTGQEYPYWIYLAAPPEAGSFTCLAQGPSGMLFAAANTHVVEEANTGAVFRSGDGFGWGPTAPLPQAWWLESLLTTAQGTVLAGGTAVFSATYPAALYKSTDAGDSWALVAQWPDLQAVHDLLQLTSGEIIAGMGSGAVLISYDGGDHWEPWGNLPGAGHVYALLQATSGEVYAGVERVDGRGAVYHRTAGGDWEELAPLDQTAAVYALLEGPGQVLYAGTAMDDAKGVVFRSLDNGQSWLPSPPLGDSQAVRSLLASPQGLYAGLDMGPGRYSSYVYFSSDGGESWADHGSLFWADAAHDLLLAADGAIYVAGGDTAGVIYRSEWTEGLGHRVYLPLILRGW
jgi:hypothetical protein